MTDTPSTLAERLVSILSGALILLMAVFAFAWAAHWTAVWLREPSGLPAEMVQVLMVAVLAGALVGFGAWRLLLLGVSGPILGLSPGRLVLATLVLGAVAGAFA